MAEDKKEAEKKKAEEKGKEEEVKAQDKKEEAKEESKAKKSDKKEGKKEEKKDKKKDEKVDIVSETVYTVPLKAAYHTKPGYRRTGKAVKILLAYLKRHTKSDNIKIDGLLNKHIWKSGASKPPRKVQIKAVKDSEGVITATLLQ